MPETDPRHYRSLIESVVRGRRWVVAMDVLAPAAQYALALLELGAEGALALGGSRGTGELPEPERVPCFELGVTASDMMGGIRAGLAAIAAPPPEVQAAIDRFDPQRAARVVSVFYGGDEPIAGRRVYGARPLAWQALEDKTVVDALWDAAGVPRAPSEVVEARPDALRGACARLAGERGAVLAGDSKEGFNGGAEYVRWASGEAQLASAIEFFGARCERVRVMPFLEGVPCSIHGLVFPDEVIALRPCEMVVFRDREGGRFVYAQAATFWEPDAAVADEMRAVAGRVGEHLRARHAFRGAFTVDGVATERGFLPTELNPRFGAALNVMTRGLEEVPLYLLNLLIAEGEPLDYRPRELERLLREHAAAHPGGGGAIGTRRRVTEQLDGEVVFEGGGVRLARDGETGDAGFRLGPGPTGGRLWLLLDPQRTPRGPSVAPRVARALRFLGERFELDLPPFEVGGADEGGGPG